MRRRLQRPERVDDRLQGVRDVAARKSILRNFSVEPPTARAEAVSNEDLEKYVRDVPLGVLGKLPECDERKQAETHIRQATDLAHRAREKHKTE